MHLIVHSHAAGIPRLGRVYDYESIVRTTRLWDHDRLHIKTDDDPLLRAGAFISCSDSDNAYLITRRRLIDDASGLSLEVEAVGATWLLERRVNWWTQRWQNVALVSALTNLLATAQQSQMGWNRTILGLGALSASLTQTTMITRQISWGSVAEAVFSLVDGTRNGFAMRIVGGELRPHVFDGRDRSSTVVFSTDWGDVLSAAWDDDSEDYRNVAVIAGEGEGAARLVTTQAMGPGSLHELYVDAKDLQRDELSEADYVALLKGRGLEKLAEAPHTRSLEAEVSEDRFVYGRDYRLGDTVSYRAFGMQGSDIISEVTETFEQGGRTLELGLGKTAPTIRRL